jgi:glutaconate CoA-transferase subunit A
MASHATPGDKRATMAEALDLLPSGQATLGIGGFMLYRRPMAFCLALMEALGSREPRPNLTLLSFTAGLESDLLVGAGLIGRVRTCYFGLEAFGLAPRYTQAAGEGFIEVIEETEASLALGLRAALSGVGFLPALAWQGTDLLRLRPDIKEVVDPYSGEILTAFPPIRCDLAVIHALRADPEGNADIGGNWGVDRELALVADRVVITAERVVPRLDTAHIYGHSVSAVVEAPGGAWPTSCHPDYPMDGEAVLAYLESGGADPSLIESWSRRLLVAE